MNLNERGGAEIGRQLKAARRMLGKTLEDVAQSAGTSKSYLSQLERGKIQNPNTGLLKRLCLALGIWVVIGDSRRPEGLRSLAYRAPTRDTVSPGSVSVEELLHETLRDGGIPAGQRDLLSGQVLALVESFRAHVASYCEEAKENDPCLQ